MDATRPEDETQRDDAHDDVRPTVQFDAIVHDSSRGWWVFGAVIGLGLYLVPNLVLLPWSKVVADSIVPWPACVAIVIAGLVGLGVSRSSGPDVRVRAAETMVAILVSWCVALFASASFDRGVVFGPVRGIRGIGLAAAMFLVGFAIAFALRRATCVVGQRNECEPESGAAARLLGGPWPSAWGLSGARLAGWFVVGSAAACAARLIDGAVTTPRTAHIACIAPLALGILCTPRIALALCIGHAIGACMPCVEPNWRLDPTPARFAVIAGLAAGGLAAVVRARKRLHAEHERLAGGERIRLEIGGLGTRLERMTPRNELQLSIGICALLCIVAVGMAAWALDPRIGAGSTGAQTLTITVVAACAAAGASLAVKRVGVGIVGGFALLLFLVPETTHQWASAAVPLQLVVMSELVRVFVPVAIFAAAVATHLQSIGARVGSTPSRTQLGMVGVALSGFCLLGLAIHLASGLGSHVVFDRFAVTRFAAAAIAPGVLGDMYGAVAAGGAALAAALECVGLPGIVVVLGLALTRGQIVLAVAGCAAGWWLRRRAAAQDAIAVSSWRSGVLALAVGELIAGGILAFV